jgi:hypothetical protein
MFARSNKVFAYGNPQVDRQSALAKLIRNSMTVPPASNHAITHLNNKMIERPETA